MTVKQLTKQLNKIEQQLLTVRRRILVLPQKKSCQQLMLQRTGGAWNKSWQKRWNATRGTISKTRAEKMLRYIEESRRQPDRGPTAR